MKFRHESKHQINLLDVYELKTRLSIVAKHDSNADANGTYTVKSLYFDNYTDKALREKIDGVNKREKFRIRYYGTDTSFIRLEKKSKINGLCSKESCRMTAEECQKILTGEIEFLKSSESELMNEFYAKMKYQLLRPTCIVAYTRESFVYPPGNVRVTLDRNIRGSYCIREFLNPDLPFLQTYHGSILEVKWDEFLPQIIRDCVQLPVRRSAAFSKYAAVRI
ncbi:MAG: polyphosphate polymerase domain-containing protein [Oscillospiraceae bacterium]|nr:polyphosphate polymerase domain-containing protein [Oscillospiraceae bacterium]